MSTNDLVQVGIYLYREQKDWVDQQPRGFSFSEWVREKVNEEKDK